MLADPAVSTLVLLLLMAAVVAAFRLAIRAPRGRSHHDPAGVRTVVVFHGNAPHFFNDDPPEGLLVGVRLFEELCEGLRRQGVAIENRQPIENAQGAQCVLGDERFRLVLEWVEERWTASVEWLPQSTAERRHVALTRRVYSPTDSPELRRLLSAMHAWLTSHPDIAEVVWHRKQDWLAEDLSEPSDRPVAENR